MIYNSDEVESVDITWRDGYKHIVVYLKNGDTYSLKNGEGVKR